MSLFNAVIALSGQPGIELAEHEPMSRHTTYRVGGPADLYCSVGTFHGLRRCVRELDRAGVPWVILGRGSNLLVADAGYRGAVIVLTGEFTKVSDDGDDPCALAAGAAVTLPRLANEALSRSLSGLEFCTGIPGSVGGAVSMNAGTGPDGFGQVVCEVTCLDPARGLVRHAHDDLNWGYRDSGIPGDQIVLECRLRLRPGDKPQIAQEMERRLARRKRTQPVGAASCGSVFRNPAGRSVGRLIDECGLKGYRVGGAEVSPVHANFIVNKGTASAADVIAVIRHVHRKVLDAYGIELQPEVKFLGF